MARPLKMCEILTPMQLERARLVSEGFTNDEIAKQQGVTPSLVKHKMTQIYGRLGIDPQRSVARVTLAVRYDREHR